MITWILAAGITLGIAVAVIAVFVVVAWSITTDREWPFIIVMGTMLIAVVLMLLATIAWGVHRAIA